MAARTIQAAQALFLGVVAMAVGGSLTAPGAAACIGGYAFDRAVELTDGGIVLAHVESAAMREDFSYDVILSNIDVVAGDPAVANPLHASMGAICDQSVEAGEQVIVLFEVGGPVSDTLASLPATDIVSTRPEAVADPVSIAPLLMTVWLGSLAIAIRRFRQR